MNANSETSAGLWRNIEREKARDALIRRICVWAWAATVILLLLFAIALAVPVLQMARAASAGAVPWATVVGIAMPFIGALWSLSLLVAALSTVAVFFRLRTASLAELQLRLAALEDLLRSRPDAH